MNSKALDLIVDEDLKVFTQSMLEQFGSDEKTENSNKVIDALIKILTKKKLLAPGVRQTFIEVLYAAGAVHNLFYQTEDLTSLFKLRQIVYTEKENYNMELIEAVLQTVESQLGEDSPVPMCKPSVNSPTEVFALAVWIAKNYTPQA